MTEFWILLAAFVSFLIILVGHWFPWGRKLKRTEAYSYGIVAIMLPYSALCFAFEWYIPMIACWCIVAAAGIGTLGAWHYDDHQKKTNLLRAEHGDED